MTPVTNKVKGLISSQVDMGTFGLVELEVRAIEEHNKSLVDALERLILRISTNDLESDEGSSDLKNAKNLL